MRTGWRTWAALAAVVFDLAIVSGTIGKNPPLIDFDVFYRAAQVVNPYPGNTNLPFVNPPSSLWLFRPLAPLSRPTAALAWTALNLVVFWFGMRRCFPSWAVALSLVSPVMVWALWLGQSTPLLAGLIGAGFAGPPLVGGLLLGLVASVKPQLLWLAPLVLLKAGDRQRMVAMLIAVAIAAIASAPLWAAWLDALPVFRTALEDQGVLTQSVSLGGLGSLIHPILLPLGVLLGLVMTALARSHGKRMTMACAVGGSVLAAPYAMPHDLVALIPVAVIALESRGRALGLAFFIGLAMPLGLLVGLWSQRSPSSDSESKTPGPKDPGVLA